VDGLYDELILNFAKNMLNSAKKDAIVFTNGDNDTFPLWYVQAKLGMRKDVAVMNTSLMNIPAWTPGRRKEYGFALGLSDKFYMDSTSLAIYFDASSQDIYGMKKLAEGLEGTKPLFLNESQGRMFVLPAKTFRLSYNENDSLAPVVRLQASYILKSDLGILDIIASNLGKRPVYFAQTALYGTIPYALSESMIHEGLLVQIVQRNHTGDRWADKNYDLEMYYQNLCVNYKYGFEKLASLQSEPIALNYIYDFNNLASALLEKGDTAKAIKALQTCLEKAGVRSFTNPLPSFLLGENLCNAGKPQDGRKLFEMAIEKMKVAYLKPENEYDLERYNSMLSAIIITSEKNGFNDLRASARGLQDKITSKIPPRKSLGY
jgi:hypothetical protein